MSERNPPVLADELVQSIDSVQRLARALLRDQDAEDLAQDVFSTVIRRPPPEGGLSAKWLAGVTRNLARFRWRSNERRRRHEANAAADAAVPTPDALVERAQAYQLLTRLLLDLDEPLRSVLLLRYFEGLSAAEIARKMGVPAGTVRWRLKRALDELRSRLDQSEGGGKRRWALLLTPLGGSSPVLKGLLIMKALKIAVGLVLLILLLLGATRWTGNHHAPPQAASATRVRRVGSERAAAVPMRAHPARRDADPSGGLRLEGQVIDEAEMPVAGAEVALDANPLRLVRSAADGSFVFEHLIGRDYRVEAKSGDAYASSVELRLTATSEPVILRLRRGGTLDVLVRDQARGTVVSSATVELRSTLTWLSRTDDSGHAQLLGVGAGWPTLHVAADGYAPAAKMLRTSGDPRRQQSQVI
jgi:RNA polymerase sigma factor (sigma-70 family)